MSASDPALERFVVDCRDLFGDGLRSVFLYGSAVTGDLRQGVSGCNVAVVLQEVRFGLLKQAAARLPDWRKSGLDPPLFLDPAFIRAGSRLFPIEFSEMKRAHRMLYGPDPLLDLACAAGDLRAQCEQELCAKLLALRQGYLGSAGSASRLLGLAHDSLKSVLIVLRNTLPLLGESPPLRLLESLGRVEARWGVALPACRRLLAVRAGEEKVKREEIHALFGAYADEVRALADGFGRTLPPEAAGQ
ncbi:MAG: hypothetical protein ACE5FC_07810 [Myxococcota bacterium]